MSDPKPASERPLYHNVTSSLGLFTAALAVILIITSFLLDQFSSQGINVYVGIFVYVVFPAMLLVGLVVFLVGMRIEAGRRRRAGGRERLPFPRVDLNDDRQRHIFRYAVLAGVVAIVATAWVSYRGYEYSESVAFCGTACHVPMQPEYTAHQYSPHAHVPCARCHVARGASWYVRSKLAGAKQLVAMITGDYQRPIPTPISQLRPVRMTCQECHWPSAFLGAKLVQIPHFGYGRDNTAQQVALTLLIGGGTGRFGKSHGIHWHTVVDSRITYAATDRRRQHIPWIKVVHRDGTSTVYREKNSGLTSKQIAKLPHHTMDCIDCHNRPAHRYPSPDRSVDLALLQRRIPRDLPWVKRVTTQALQQSYPDRGAAHDGIRRSILGYYQMQEPALLQTRRKDIDQTVKVAQTIFDRSVFPRMDVDWRTYPDNAGHMFWPGCFRCHDGRHVSSDGRVLSRNCSSTCHTAPRRGALSSLGQPSPHPEQAWHPPVGGLAFTSITPHNQMPCNNCHSVGARPADMCKNCHH